VTDLQAAVAQGTQSSVNLHFTVAGEDLAVRVALQEGQVHTQFTTNSGELRTALAHEWQSVGSNQGTARFAEPVFTSQQKSDTGPDRDLAGSGGRERDWSHNEADGQGPGAASATPTRPSARAPEPEPEAASASATGHLQSFA
jgi:hypothetical protein